MRLSYPHLPRSTREPPPDRVGTGMQLTRTTEAAVVRAAVVELCESFPLYAELAVNR